MRSLLGRVAHTRLCTIKGSSGACPVVGDGKGSESAERRVCLLYEYGVRTSGQAWKKGPSSIEGKS